MTTSGPTTPPDQPEGPASYAERYRGTEWGSQLGQPTALSRRPKRRAPLVVAGAVLLVVAVALGAFGLAGGFGSGGFGSGGGASPTGVASSGTGPSATAIPTPSVDVGAAVLARFVARISDPRLSYHVAVVATTRAPGDTGRTTESLDVSGDDFVGTIDSRGPGASGLSHVVRKAHVIYVRRPPAGWISKRTDDRYFRLTPFLYLAGNDIAYVRPTVHNGVHVHLLRTTQYYRPDEAALLNLAAIYATVDKVSLDVYVTDAGIPVAADFRLEAGGVDATGSPLMLGRASRIFTRWGKPVTVRAPKR